jgi:hypothetical protein
VNEDVWEARPPPQLLLAVSLLAGLVTLDGFALGHLVSTGDRTPATVGAVAIGLACGQVAVSTIFFTLGSVGFARKGILVLAAIAYGGGLLSAAATVPTRGTPLRWDAACGELFILAAIVAVPGAALRLFGLRLIHRSVPLEGQGQPWQFTLEGVLAFMTAVACFSAATRWIMTSKTSGVGILLEWFLLVTLPWICFLLVSPPLHPLASLTGVFVAIGLVTGLSMLVATFLGRPAMGLTACVEIVLCAALFAALRWTGYEIRLAMRR